MTNDTLFNIYSRSISPVAAFNRDHNPDPDPDPDLDLDSDLDPDKPASHKHVAHGVIGGIIIICVALLSLCVFLAYWCHEKNKREGELEVLEQVSSEYISTLHSKTKNDIFVASSHILMSLVK